MSESHFDLRRFSGRVPLFPLPSVFLFPGAMLPLHVFEPRYRRMVRDAAAGERLIGMALLRPGWEPNYRGRPPIFGVCGVGRIVKQQSLEGGRFNIVLEGLFRAAVVVEDRAGGLPYRMATVEPLLDAPSNSEDAARKRLIDAFECYRRFRWATSEVRPVDPHLPLGALAFRLAALSDIEVQSKHQVLEAGDPVFRARMTAGLLEKRVEDLQALRARWIVPNDVDWN